MNTRMQLLEGYLTYAKLIKMYTNQCFHKYPHFQLSELNEGKRHSNNTNRFRSSFGKGKQEKGEGKGKEMMPYREWRNGNKGKRGNLIKDPGPTIMGKPIPKIRTKPKEKDMEKDSKGKARKKASHATTIGRKNTMKRTIKTMEQKQYAEGLP
jgi:hypothetical protein